jgi:AraC-like DNA-binding protein
MLHYEGKFPGKNILMDVRYHKMVTGSKGTGMPPHSHGFNELLVFIEGTGKHIIDRNTYLISPGSGFLIAKNQSHFLKDCKNLSFFELLYMPKEMSFAEKYLRKMPGYRSFFLFEPDYRNKTSFQPQLILNQLRLAEVVNIFSYMIKLSLNKTKGYEILLLSKTMELFWFLSQEYSKSTKEDAKSLMRMEKVIIIMEKNYYKNITLEGLAKIVNMSKSNFLRIFKSAIGKSPIDYLIDLRIKHAIDLLKNSGLTVKEISAKTGFVDNNYFSRTFKKRIGVNPKKYKQVDCLISS